MLKQQVLQTIKKYNMLESGDKVLVGVSGGPDSVVLLLLLKELSKELKIKLYIASLNHMFREKEAEKDIKFVQALTDKLNLPIFVDKIDVPKIHKERGGSKEDLARQLRYEFFKKAAKEFGANKIALGHSKDDQAETVLMRLIYGAGMLGLSGIPPTRKFDKYVIIRPLIEISRPKINAYLKRRHIKARLDSTNLNNIYRRNEIRNKLLPLLEKYNPKIKDALSRSAETLRGDYDLIEKFLLKKTLAKYIKITKNGLVKINLKDFDKLHPALKKYILRECLKGIEYRHEQKLEEFIAKRKNNSEMHLPAGYRARVEVNNLIFGSRYGGKNIRVKKPAIVTKILFRIPPLTKIKQDKKARYLDFDKISLPLGVRFRRPGDRFMPLGMQRYKKLQDFFVDKKIPVCKRDKIPLVISKSKIICVGNIQIADFAKITPTTKRVLKVRLS